MTATPHIAVIVGTTRATRFGDKPAQWIYEIASARTDMTAELVDLRDYPMPFFDEPASNAWVASRDPVAQRWQKKIDEFDGYIFVTAEYNRSLSGVLKNALDYAYPEWNRKAAAFVGYGSVGAARSVEQLRLICVELQMAPLRSGIHIQGADFLAVLQQGRPIKDLAYFEQGSRTLLDELHWWARALMIARGIAE